MSSICYASQDYIRSRAQVVACSQRHRYQEQFTKLICKQNHIGAVSTGLSITGLFLPIVYASVITPACRTYIVKSEGTGSSVSLKGMTGLLMLLGEMEVTGTPTGRTLAVEPESRLYTVAATGKHLF